MGNILAVIGGQYGSEGKGVIVNALAREYSIHVRVGGPNAGHSFNHEGRVWKMQSIPCGWAANPSSLLVIGRGALISLKQLSKEVLEIAEVDPTIWDRLMVDRDAGVIDPGWHNEGHTDGELHLRIGSTGEGIGAARVARANRNPHNFYTFGQAMDRFEEYKHLRPLEHRDTVRFLDNARRSDMSILLEGTQGAGLSLIHGPWPYVTSSDVGVAQMCADMGLAPSHVNQVLMVVRTHPIRVAGNSGPLYGEMTWNEISQKMGKPTEERTTVTKKVRRIGRWDDELVHRSVMLNNPSSMAVTFLDYLNSSDEGVDRYEELSATSKAFIQHVTSTFGRPVSMLGTGGTTWTTIRAKSAL